MSFQYKNCGDYCQNSNNICGNCNQKQVKSNVEQKWQCKNCKNSHNPEVNLQKEFNSQKVSSQQSPVSKISMIKNCSTCSQSNNFQAKMCINCDQQFHEVKPKKFFSEVISVTKICKQCHLEIEEEQHLNHYQQCLQKSAKQLKQLHETEPCGYCDKEILKKNFQDHWLRCLESLQEQEIKNSQNQ